MYSVPKIRLETSSVADALAGLRANEARYFWNKFKVEFEMFSVVERPKLMADITDLLERERGLVFAAKPLEIAQLFLEARILWTHVFYENGLAINVLYELDNPKKRAVGVKLSDGMEIPAELVDKFKFARQKSKLADTIRGSYFTLKGDNEVMIKRWLDNVNNN
ncbi:phage tail protein [uncultured Streptococcus sp.]|uniref:phage tail protein n=1 Tax=uncultured Streptococcus sp. TaxID=83427 RepID=UPI0027DCA356|nr:phage tail protein [uncultured Streptococcus sp.]